MTFETWFPLALPLALASIIPAMITRPVVVFILGRAGGAMLVGAGLAPAAMPRS